MSKIRTVKSYLRKIPYMKRLAFIVRKYFLFVYKGFKFKNHRAYLEKKIKTNDFLPKIIHVETRSMCNGSCSFCAAAVQFKTRPDILMSDQRIEKIINELSEYNYSNRLSFYSNNYTPKA